MGIELTPQSNVTGLPRHSLSTIEHEDDREGGFISTDSPALRTESSRIRNPLVGCSRVDLQRNILAPNPVPLPLSPRGIVQGLESTQCPPPLSFHRPPSHNARTSDSQNDTTALGPCPLTLRFSMI
jgi:hypothetical protein